MDIEKALEILLQNIHGASDLEKPESRWILHCIHVGIAAGRIARELSLKHDLDINEEYATAIGFLHDIGRMFDHNNHVIEGYNYLCKLGYPDVARYCLTHSFVDNIIPNTIGRGPDKESYAFINNHLNKIQLNVYDNIVQLCDLFCLDTGFTTFEKRILDVTQRKGVFENSSTQFKSIMQVKERIEILLGKDIYSLFPEIKKEDLDSVEEDREKLLKMFENGKNK